MTQVRTLALDDNNSHLLLTDQRYHFFPKHYHETYSIAMLFNGAKNFSTKHESGILDENNLATMNPGEIHYGDSVTKEGWNQAVILFDRKSADKFIEENDLKAQELVFCKTIKNNLKYRAEMQEVYYSIANSENEMEKEQHFQTMLGLVFSKEKEKNVQKVYSNISGIRKTIELMNEEPSAKHTLDELAETADMSKFHFLRTFKDATGMTPHAYLNVLRVERARMKMLTTSLNLADISAECGFSDQAHFTRAYKKVYGTPPGRLIKF